MASRDALPHRHAAVLLLRLGQQVVLCRFVFCPSAPFPIFTLKQPQNSSTGKFDEKTSLMCFAPNSTGGEWSDLPQHPETPAHPQAPLVGAHKGEVWIVGGSRKKTVHIYNPMSKEWRKVKFTKTIPCENRTSATTIVSLCLSTGVI